MVHSDRGSQFRSKAFVRTLEHNGLVGSMGRVGACGDNAAMESFFSLLQKNGLDQKRWESRDELRLAIVTWIERTYHRRRRQRSLGRLTPIEFELLEPVPEDTTNRVETKPSADPHVRTAPNLRPSRSPSKRDRQLKTTVISHERQSRTSMPVR